VTIDIWAAYRPWLSIFTPNVDCDQTYVFHISLTIDICANYRSWPPIYIYISILVITVDNWHIYRLWLICEIYNGDHGRYLAIYRWSRSICSPHIDCHGRCVTYISIFTVDIWCIYSFVRYFFLSDKMSNLDVISNNLDNTPSATHTVEAHRRYRGVVYCRNVLRFHSLRDFICAHNKDTAFPAPGFSWLTNAQPHYIQVSYTKTEKEISSDRTDIYWRPSVKPIKGHCFAS